MKENSASGVRGKRRPGWFSKIALEDALAQGGCPICRAMRKSVLRYLRSFLYEGMMSPIARQEFLDGGGFCHQHFWEAKQIEEEHWAEGFGVAILCDNLIENSLRDLKRLRSREEGSKAKWLKIRRTPAKGSGLVPGIDCKACAVSKSSEEQLLITLERLLEEANFRERYAQVGGICLTHLQTASLFWTSIDVMGFVKSIAEGAVRQLLDDLREFQRKHDYQYKGEPKGPEWSSPERAIQFLVGPRIEVNELVHPPPSQSKIKQTFSSLLRDKAGA